MIDPKSPIREFMTKLPLAINDDMTLADARTRMAVEGVRHLPVMQNDTVVGIVSARDILVLESLDGVEPTRDTVDAAMTAYPDNCEPGTALAEVLARMVERDIGAMIVIEDHQLRGIFTTVDACRLLQRTLEG